MATGTVYPIRDQSRMALGSAVEAFLVTLDHPESHGTRRVYASTLRALRAEFGDATDTGTLEPGHMAAWFTRQGGQAAPATWNRNLDAIRSALRYWQDQQWMNATDLTSALWRLLYETAARSAEVLRLDVEDLDLPNRRAKVRRKGRRDRRHRLADRDRPAAAPAAERPQGRTGVSY